MESTYLIWAKIQALITPKFIVGMTIVSAAMAIGSLFVMPFILCQIPADYFNHEKPHLLTRIKSASLLKSVMLIAKNFFGFLLFLAGILMIFLPGQGLLTILIGLVLMDFPGKFTLERKIIRMPKILAAVNWFRARGGHSAMIISEQC